MVIIYKIIQHVYHVLHIIDVFSIILMVECIIQANMDKYGAIASIFCLQIMYMYMAQSNLY